MATSEKTSQAIRVKDLEWFLKLIENNNINETRWVKLVYLNFDIIDRPVKCEFIDIPN